MMSISQGMSAGHAGGYFSWEGYYLRGDSLAVNSSWVGSGSRAVGREGAGPASRASVQNCNVRVLT